MGAAKRTATCAILAALCVVMMLLGAVLELGMYAAPMLAGLFLIIPGKQFGRRYQLMLWAAVSILSFLLVPSLEENLLFAGLLGWYPALWPSLQKLPRLLRPAVKLLLFNAVITAIEVPLMHLFFPEDLGTGMLILLLLLANITFWLYDRLIPLFEHLLRRIFNRR